MSLRPFRITLFALLACLVAVPLTAPAIAQQSTRELRQENQRLRAQIADLQAELEAAKEESARLRDANQRLQELVKQLQAARGSSSRPPVTPVEPEKVTVDESKPDASPRALLTAIRSSYNEQFADVSHGTSPDDTARASYLRQLDRWIRRVNREFRTPVEWIVRADSPARAIRGGYLLTVQAVDPETAVKLGDPFDIRLAPPLYTRLRDWEQRGRFNEDLILVGTLIPGTARNDDRENAGLFDNPPFIGPFVEFYMGVEAQSLRPRPEEKEDEKEDDEAKG